MENMNTKINVCFPGLNQLYHVGGGKITYNKLYTRILEEVKDDDFLKSYFLKQKNQDISRLEYTKFKKELNQTYSIDIIARLRSCLTPLIQQSVTFIKEPHLQLLDQEMFSLNVINSNVINLLIDEAIVSFNLQTSMFNFLTSDELKKEITKENGVQYIICDHDIYNINDYHKMNCWTVLLTNYSYCHNEKEPNTEEAAIVNDLNEYLNDLDSLDGLSEGKYIRNESFNFTSYNFYQLAYYYKLIPIVTQSASLISECVTKLNELIQQDSPLIILLFMRTICRGKVFLKQRYFISNKKVLYKAHIGSSNIRFNGHFDLMLTKAVEVKDLMLYSNIFSKLSAYCSKYNIKMINDISKFPQFVEKDKMNKYLDDFCKEKTTLKICDEFNANLFYPKSFILPIEKFTNKEAFFSILDKNSFRFPLIIKFKGKASFFKHRIAIIFEEKDYDSFITTISPYIEPDLSLIIQRHVNHGASLLKIYKIGNEMFIDYRSSLPDISSEFKSHYPQGHWLFRTIDLESPEYLSTIWKEFGRPNMLQQTIESDPSITRFLYSITNVFEQYSNSSLFGIDILLDYNKMSFYLIDCNALPGYKIKSIKIDEKMTNFFVDLYDQSITSY